MLNTEAYGIVACPPAAAVPMKASTLRHGLNLWPPFLFSGIHVTRIGADYRSAEVELRMRPWNRNYVRTHFGGSLFAMTDPFWMLLTLKSLGDGYVVWDQAGSIEFVKPGRGTVRARFDLDEAVLEDLRAAAADGGKVLRWFDTDVLDEAGEVVTRVRKQLYVRRKRGR
ncbi:DUF4442 domain-containing protein [Thermomonas brevis]